MHYLIYVIRHGFRIAANLLRSAQRAPNYITFTLETPLSEMAPPKPSLLRRLFAPKQPTLRELGEQFRRVAEDPRVQGVILRLYEIAAPMAQLQALRDRILALRAAGKQVVVWSHSYDMPKYYVAAAADKILLQKAGTVSACGLESHHVFLADALRRMGIQGDFVQITPYKTASDTLMRSSMSEPAREMATWLLDDLYAQIIAAVAEGREISQDEARALIDGCPYPDQQAQSAGAVDAVLGEEELPAYLGTESQPATLSPYAAAQRKLRLPRPARPGKVVALLRIAGDIIDGRSATPPLKIPFRVPLLFTEKAGDLTVVHQARALAKNRRVAAVVVHVDSGGGSATSSEAMAAALQTVAEKKPLLVSMGTAAASGGYYVATPAARIIAQPGTLTGSIGVLSGKLVTAGLFERLLIHRETLGRGEHAAYYSAAQPFTDEERTSLRDAIVAIYDRFLERVAASRHQSKEQVDAVGGGRVWTGQQALAHGLVDELGGLDLALQRAREAAGLDPHARVVEVRPSKRLLAPSGASASAWLSYAARGLTLLRPGSILLLSSMFPRESA